VFLKIVPKASHYCSPGKIDTMKEKESRNSLMRLSEKSLELECVVKESSRNFKLYLSFSSTRQAKSLQTICE
jgi:hypothetical protein